MKALICTALGSADSLEVGEIDAPVAGPGQVVIRVCTAGVNFPDHLVIHGLYQFSAEPPFVPGGELAGWVDSVGPDVDGLAIGDRVLYVGVAGGMAEYAVAPADECIPVPDDIPLATAATLGMAYGTTLYALETRGQLQSGEILAVLGAAGGVGLAAIKIGKALGATVIAAASTAEKRALCKQAGADAVIDYVHDDLKKKLKILTNGRGADVVYDPVGGDYTEQALRATAWNGRYLILGWASGKIPRIPTNLMLLKGCAMVGVFWGSHAHRDRPALLDSFERLFDLYRRGTVVPHVAQTYPLAEAGQAIAAIGERRVLGKVVVSVSAEA